MRTIHFMGISNGLKPLYILDSLVKHRVFFRDKKIFLITDLEKNNGEIEKLCFQNGITVLKVDASHIENNISDILPTEPELLVTIGWSKLIPMSFLSVFKYAINCHGGLLPDNRGNNVYMHNYANLSGYYGATVHYMNKNFDDGNIILKSEAKLFLEETPLIIHRRICEMTAAMIPEAIQLVWGGYAGEKQTGIARYFYKLSRSEMESLRQKNIDNIRKGKPLEITRHKEWKL